MVGLVYLVDLVSLVGLVGLADLTEEIKGLQQPDMTQGFSNFGIPLSDLLQRPLHPRFTLLDRPETSHRWR